MSVSHSLLTAAASAAILGKTGLSMIVAKGLAFAGIAATPLVRHANWAACRQLEEMSDSDLRDIGLTRGDVMHARGTALADDPTVELARLRDERR